MQIKLSPDDIETMSRVLNQLLKPRPKRIWQRC